MGAVPFASCRVDICPYYITSRNSELRGLGPSVTKLTLSAHSG